MTAWVSSLGRLPEWDCRLLHERAGQTLIWLTRGQGRAITEGLRQGRRPPARPALRD